jgi:hypothetical protein
MDQVQYSEELLRATTEGFQQDALQVEQPDKLLEEFQQRALQLQMPDKLLAACAAAQERILEPRVVGNCGSAELHLYEFSNGYGNIDVVLDSFLGRIRSVAFVGAWVKLAFPPATGFFSNANSQIFGIGTPHVVLRNTFKPGAGNIVANLTFLWATTLGGNCVGLLPSGSKVFV